MSSITRNASVSIAIFKGIDRTFKEKKGRNREKSGGVII